MRKGVCKHHTGTVLALHSDEPCAAGVRYRDVTPNPDGDGSGWRRPCSVVESEHGLDVLREYGPQGTCDKYKESTAEELAAAEAEITKATRRMMRTLPLIKRIKEEHSGEQWRGTEKCPECGGILHLSHAAHNGHVWGKCETEGCLAWME